MKAPVENSQENQAMTPAKENNLGPEGGNAEFADNRAGAFQLKKLREGFAGSPPEEGGAQLQQSMQEGGGQDRFPIQRKTNKTGLPDQLKSGVENLSGFSMDDVKVHYNSSKPAQLQAHAYAQGTDIHLGPGQEKHLGHEAWHVVQQKQGRVKPTRQLKSKVSINDDAGLEREADVMGAKALRGGNFGQRLSLETGNQGVRSTVQRVERETQPGEFLGKALEKMEEVLEKAKELNPKVQAIDLTEFEQDYAGLKADLEELEDEGERIKAIDDFLSKHKDLVQEVHLLNQDGQNFKIEHRNQLRKLGKKNPEINEFEKTGEIAGLDEPTKKAFYSVLTITARIGAASAELYDTTSKASFEMQLLRVDELANREVHKDHVAGLPEADIYIPASGKTNRVTYVAHGDHTALKGTDGATFKAPKGVTMAYTAPHGYDALASLTSAWGSSNQGTGGREGGRDVLYNFSPGPISRRYLFPRWYDYTLTPENKHMGDQMRVNLQNLADQNGVTAVVIKESTTTSELLPQLTALGYTNLLPVHCRGTHNQESQMWAAKNYDDESKMGYGLSLAKDTYANAVSDPGPKVAPSWIISRENLLSEGTFMNATDFMPLSAQNLANAKVVTHVLRGTYHWLWGLTGTQAYLRGLSVADAGLMAQEDDDFIPEEGAAAARISQLGRDKIKAGKLLTHHQRLDNLQKVTPTMLSSYEAYK